jgi:hypothetical protein
VILMAEKKGKGKSEKPKKERAKREKKAPKPTADLRDKKFKQTCQVKGRDGTFFLVRKGDNKTRIAPMEGDRGSGELVDTKDVHNVQDVPGSEEEKGAKKDAKKDDLTKLTSAKKTKSEGESGGGGKEGKKEKQNKAEGEEEDPAHKETGTKDVKQSTKKGATKKETAQEAEDAEDVSEKDSAEGYAPPNKPIDPTSHPGVVGGPAEEASVGARETEAVRTAKVVGAAPGQPVPGLPGATAPVNPAVGAPSGSVVDPRTAKPVVPGVGGSAPVVRPSGAAGPVEAVSNAPVAGPHVEVPPETAVAETETATKSPTNTNKTKK